MSQIHNDQAIIEHYRDLVGHAAFTLEAALDWAVAHGYDLPVPPTGRELALRNLRRAASAQHKEDEETKRPYRVWHPVLRPGQLTLWHHIDDAPPEEMELSLQQRRTGVVADLTSMVNDKDRWNKRHPNERQIELALDFTLDVELENIARDSERKGAA